MKVTGNDDQFPVRVNSLKACSLSPCYMYTVAQRTKNKIKQENLKHNILPYFSVVYTCI